MSRGGLPLTESIPAYQGRPGNLQNAVYRFLQQKHLPAEIIIVERECGDDSRSKLSDAGGESLATDFGNRTVNLNRRGGSLSER